VVIRRSLVVLLVQKRLKRRLLIRTAFQDEKHSIHRQIKRRCALVEFGAREGVCVARDCNKRRFVNWLVGARKIAARALADSTKLVRDCAAPELLLEFARQTSANWKSTMAYLRDLGPENNGYFTVRRGQRVRLIYYGANTVNTLLSPSEITGLFNPPGFMQ